MQPWAERAPERQYSTHGASASSSVARVGKALSSMCFAPAIAPRATSAALRTSMSCGGTAPASIARRLAGSSDLDMTRGRCGDLRARQYTWALGGAAAGRGDALV